MFQAGPEEEEDEDEDEDEEEGRDWRKHYQYSFAISITIAVKTSRPPRQEMLQLFVRRGGGLGLFDLLPNS